MLRSDCRTAAREEQNNSHRDWIQGIGCGEVAVFVFVNVTSKLDMLHRNKGRDE